MKVTSLTFLRLLIPFKGHFAHAEKVRSESDTILVRLETASGHVGWGEVLARSYVTGETHDTIMQASAEVYAGRLLHQNFENQSKLACWIEGALEDSSAHLALFSGLEVALWNAMALEQGIDLSELLGAKRQSPTGHCVTVGFDAEEADLRVRAIHARLQKASVVKVKVGLGHDADVARLHTLNRHFSGQMPLRIDGNSSFELLSAEALLHACKDLPLESFEEPLSRHSPDVEYSLIELHKKSGVPLLADESVCSMDDARLWIAKGAYQQFNIRLGKQGGLLASCRLRDLAQQHNIKLVGGSMVGESGVLTQASRVFLSRSNSIAYVEGLGQNRSWLAIDPVSISGESAETLLPLSLRTEACQPLIQDTRKFD